MRYRQKLSRGAPVALQCAAMAAGAGDHLMLSRLGLGEDNAENAGSSTVLLHENVVPCLPQRRPAPARRGKKIGSSRP